MQPEYARALELLRAGQTTRVWSLLVTVFGDLAQQEGDSIEGPVLTAVMGDMGIKPEATRVALHRLRNDAWIISEKSGRTSKHSLSQLGRQESAAVSDVIYGKPENPNQGWQIILLETVGSYSKEVLAARGFAPLAPRLFIGSADLSPPPNTFALHADETPDWLGQQIEPTQLNEGYSSLHERLKMITEPHLAPGALSPLQIGVLRCLIVHNWRRLVLKHPKLPQVLATQTWRGHDCRRLVTDLLENLPRPTLNELHRTVG